MKMCSTRVKHKRPLYELISFALIFILSINSFAAIVSDNDGSAFITKAEFDSLKNNFQSQIDNYNLSIDSKIDGAIASYLAGISVDDSKKYRIFGASYGPAPSIWNGKKANYFRLVESMDQIYGSQASSTDRYLDITSRTKTNRGYGFGWWITACHSASGTITFDEASGLVQSKKPKLEYVSGADAKIKTKAPGESTCVLTEATSASSTINSKTLFNGPLSDVFQTGIELYDPQIPFYEFLSDGDIVMNFGCASNGYSYEGGTWGGSNYDAGWHHGKEVGIYLRHAGVDTQIVSLAGTWSGSGWISSGEISVKAGDQIIWKRGSDNTDTNQTNAYAIYWFERELPGWEISTG